MHPPYGPFKIGVNRQITIPAELLRRIDLAPGDSVYVAMAEELDGALVVVPVEKLVSWIDAGRRLEGRGGEETANDDERETGPTI